MKADFHVHTKASDGEFDVVEMVKRAKENNLTHIAITDHDVYDIVDIDKSNFDTEGITIIPSAEFEAARNIDAGTKMHILGLNIDVNNKTFIKYSKKYYKSNLKFVYNFYNKLNKIYGLKVKESSLKRTAKLTYWGIAGKMAYKMIEQGLSQKSKFDLVDEIRVYLNKKHYDFNNEKNIIKIIKKAGGIPVLAHPCSLKLNDEALDQKVAYLKKLGIQAIEVYHPNITAEQTIYYKKLADKYNLYTSGGSDFHRYFERPDVFVSDKGKNKVTIFNALGKIKPI